MIRILPGAASALFLALAAARANPPGPHTAVPASCGQLVVALADTWNSSRGQLLTFVRKNAAAPWQPDMDAPVPVLFGRSGLAWGRGVIPVPHGQNGIPSKREKDFRTPAGCFRIGTLYGYATQPPQGVVLPYHHVTARDCWVDDPASAFYNRHVEIDPGNPPPWHEKQRMRLGDFAYEWLLEIRHNADPPVPGAGSAIFFHIRRGPDRPSAGCITMARNDLVQLLARLRPRLQPHGIFLPKAEFAVRQNPWGLPAWKP
ncbi:MAG: L,D-transpeptidase family protein [Verrucomicrobiales bacterium]|nr:L,D-transpeptidase family protein [Verrucomicrobiales bacterium]